jgi:FixJ family two-component response regulator
MNIFDVIIVDDMPEFTRNIKKILEIESLKLKVFDEPESFLDFAKNKDFDSCKVLVVDYSMPYLTGHDVFKELFSIKKGHINFKKILYTANLEQIPGEEKNYIESLGIDFLKKPNIKELINLILEEVNT